VTGILSFLPSLSRAMMRGRARAALLLIVAPGLPIGVFAAEAESVDGDEIFRKTVTPLIAKYCYDCHGDGKSKGDLTLDEDLTVAAVEKHRMSWEAVLRNVRSHEMPPADDADEVPTQEERDVIVGWLEKQLYRFDPANPDPGKVTLRRLNRAEYNATIRDLVGVDFKPAADFPPDDSGYGFDNIGDVLSLPPVLMEKYLSAAERILDQAIVTDPIKSEVKRVPASLAEVGFNAIGDRGDGWVHLISLEEDDVAVPLNVPAGDYIVRVHAFSTRDGGAVVGQGSEKPLVFKDDPGPTKFSILLNDAVVQEFELTRDEAKPGIYEARVGVPAGRQYFRAAVRRKRGGSENELFMLNGRIGKQQPGIVFVKWIEIEGPLPAATRRFRADKLETAGQGRITPNAERVLENNGEIATTVDLTRETEVILRAQAYAQQAGDEPARMEFRLDGQALKTFDVLAPATMTPIPGQRLFSHALLVPVPYIYEVRTKLPAGRHRFAAAFINDFSDPENKNPNLRDRNLIFQHLEVAAIGEPVLIPPLPDPLRELFTRHQPPAAKPGLLARIAGQTPKAISATETARGIVGDFARRAWRSPITAEELDRLMKLYELARSDGDSFEGGVKLAMKAVLVSSRFLFLGQARGPEVASTAPQPLDDFALASRLSYFLWSSMPDDELLNLAERGQLRANQTAQVKRMLASPKAIALVDNFAGQWLQIRSLESFQPDRKLFPEYDPALRIAMQRETELFFENILREDRSVFDFLTGDYTFVNARLAKLYGLPGVNGESFQRVSLASTPRRGVLTHASVLTLTSNPNRTSPVKRGLWVLENLLGTPPPPAPPNVPELDDKARNLAGTLRQQMEQHRANPSCASCHARMDPIGFGLENFNAIGAWRDKEGEAPIDPSGKLVTGDAFAGAAELTEVLATKRRKEFLHCLAEKMLTYALGRGMEYHDRPALEKIAQALDQNQGKFSSLILAVTESFPFQMRRGAPPAEKPATPAQLTSR
jgi:mono/diheme cytochrome c family protein